MMTTSLYSTLKKNTLFIVLNLLFSFAYFFPILVHMLMYFKSVIMKQSKYYIDVFSLMVKLMLQECPTYSPGWL